jgi:hypothetical protein
MISDTTAKYLSAFFDAALKYKVLPVRFVNGSDKRIPRFELVKTGKWVNGAVHYFSTICILQIVAFLIWQVTFSDYSISNKLYTVGLISMSLLVLSGNSFLHFKIKDCVSVSNMLLRLMAVQGKVHNTQYSEYLNSS